MNVEGNEFPDWELLHPSEESVFVDPMQSVEKIQEFDDIEGASEGMVQTDYFSLDSHGKYAKDSLAGDLSEGGSVGSDNPSWIDPVPEVQYPREGSSLFWSDSSSDPYDDRKLGDFNDRNKLNLESNGKAEFNFEGAGEIGAGGENPGKFWSESGGIEFVSIELNHLEENKDMGFIENGTSRGGLEFPGEIIKTEITVGGSEQPAREDNAMIEAVESCGRKGKKCVVWWKLPLEFFKYCVFRVSPVWTFSFAAAVMGFALLASRLYKMKRKTRSLPIKVTVDDKKVSHYISKATRLNEAFSVVRRVPVIRPSLPAAGLAQWPAMSLR